MENCEHCNRELTKTLEGRYIRRYITGKTVCSKCAGNYARHRSLNPSRIEGIHYKNKCEHCNSDERSPFLVNDKFVCARCKRSYDYNGFITPPIVKKTKEEKLEYSRQRSREKSQLLKERKAYIATLTPEQLIQLVREGEEEGRLK